jgi:DNA-binding transcriptional regulator YbjK
MVDDYGQQLIQGILSNGEDYRVCLDKLTGAFVTLEPLYTMAVAYKENEEIKAYVSMKRELEGKGEKIVAATLDKEASASVAIQRRIRNILEGYVEACSKAIGTCQTQLKRLELEYRSKN